MQREIDVAALGLHVLEVATDDQVVGDEVLEARRPVGGLRGLLVEAVAADVLDAGVAVAGETRSDDPHAALAENLWHLKALAEAQTRLINPPERIDAIAHDILQAGKVFIIGLGEDGIPARAFATRLSMLGIVTVHYVDAQLMQAGVCTAAPDDVLLVFSEHGRQPALCQISHFFRERDGKVVSVTRHTPNPLRAHAGAALLVSAHDERRHIEPLLYQSALQHLLDLIFILLCEASEDRRMQLDINLERMQDLMDT